MKPYPYCDWLAGIPIPHGWDGADAVDDGWTAPELTEFMKYYVSDVLSPFPDDELAAGTTKLGPAPKAELAPVAPSAPAPVTSSALVQLAEPRVGSTHFSPTAFTWRDPRTIEPRQWLYGQHLIRQFTSITIAPGGVGKSTLAFTDCIAMASGRTLIRNRPHGRLNVWAWNGEDPFEEMERRVTAACLRLGVEPSEIEGRLFLDSGREMAIKIATLGKAGPEVTAAVIDALVAAIVDRGIDVLVIDPLVAIHNVPENDNGAMDAVLKALAQIAHRANCAIEIFHHTRKLNGAENDMDSARGGSAIAGAVRSARALNVMSPEAAGSFGISEADRRSFVRIDDVKSNLASQGAAHWFRLVAEPLGNQRDGRHEDWVAVAEPWSPPDALAGVGLAELAAVQECIHEKCLRENIQANDWVGHEMGRVLGLNSRQDPDRRKIKSILRQWLASGALIVTKMRDEKGNDRPIVDVGEWARAP